MRMIKFFIAVALVFAVGAGSAQANSLSQGQSPLDQGVDKSAAYQEPSLEQSAPGRCGAKTSAVGETGENQSTRIAAEMEECPSGSGKRCPVGTWCYCDSKGCFCVSKPPWK